MQSLTAMLLQRQSMLEAAVAEKNSMALQLEREKVRKRILKFVFGGNQSFVMPYKLISLWQQRCLHETIGKGKY